MERTAKDLDLGVSFNGSWLTFAREESNRLLTAGSPSSRRRKSIPRLTPLDEDGKPSRHGKIAFVSIGMSNTAGEFAMFKKIADKDPEKSPQVVLVNCAVGGAGAASSAGNSERVW